MEKGKRPSGLHYTDQDYSLHELVRQAHLGMRHPLYTRVHHNILKKGVHITARWMMRYLNNRFSERSIRAWL